jgi:Tol biopolymer transport system component
MLDRPHSFAACLTAIVLAASAPLAAEIALDRMELISRTELSPGDAHGGRQEASPQAFSADGRYVAWASTSSALVAGIADSNGDFDVFLADLEEGPITLLSRSESDPNRANGGARPDPMISADGRFVLFTMGSDPGAPASREQVYLYDRIAGSSQRVSHAAASSAAANGSSRALGLSADGRWVAFESTASNLVAGVVDTFGSSDVFLWDRLSDSSQLVSHRHDDPLIAAEEAGSSARLSPDGRWLAYAAASDDLIPNGVPNSIQVYLFDRQTGANLLASRTPSGQPGSGWTALALTPDGRFTLFDTGIDGSNMIPGLADQLTTNDLFLFDRQTSAVELISRAAGAALATGNAQSLPLVALSDDGLEVYFISWADDLAAGTTDPHSPDLFLRDRQAATTTLISHAAGNPTLAAHVTTFPIFGTSDGGSVAFSSESTSLVAGTSGVGIGVFAYRYDAGLGQISLLSHAPGSPSVARLAQTISMSADGQHLLWSTRATNPLTGESDPQPEATDAVVHDRGKGQSILVSRAASAGFEANDLHSSATARLSGDGRQVAFRTWGESCALGQPVGPFADRACLLDRETGELRLLSHRWDDPEVAVGAATTKPLEFSQDGEWLLLSSEELGIAPTDTAGTCDLFLYHTGERTFELVSDLATSTTTAAGLSCQDSVLLETAIWSDPKPRPLLRDDAGRVLFTSEAATLDATTTDGNGAIDVYFKNRATGLTRLLTTSVLNPAQAANGPSRAHELTTDGQVALLTSRATNLLSGFVDNNGVGGDVFLFDLQLGTRTLISRSTASSLQSGNQSALDLVAMSTGGAFIAFSSRAGDHITGSDGGEDVDTFLYTRATGAITLVSHALGGPNVGADGDSYLMDMSSDGRYVLFLSDAPNLAAVTVQPESPHLYLWDRLDGSVRLVSHRQGQATQAVETDFGVLTADGRRAVFNGFSPTVTSVPDFNESYDLFLWESAGSAVSLLSRRFEAPPRAGADFSPDALPQFDDAGLSILFGSGANDLVGGNQHDINPGLDLFLAHLGDALFADGFEIGTTGAWSATVP